MKNLKLSIIILSSALLLSACSFEEIFSKLATSDIEQGASEEYAQSKAIEAKKAKIDTKKSQYKEVAEMKNVNEKASDVAFAFRTQENGQTRIAVEAMLGDPGNQIYEVWLRGGENDKEKKNLGAMQFNQSQDYSFEYETRDNLEGFDTILISRETTPDEQPETIIMTGAFSIASPSAKINE